MENTDSKFLFAILLVQDLSHGLWIVGSLNLYKCLNWPFGWTTNIVSVMVAAMSAWCERSGSPVTAPVTAVRYNAIADRR
jgi:hypothetical protein